MVTRVLARLCALPPGKKKDGARSRLQRFRGERERRFPAAAFFYPLLLALLSDKKKFWNSIVLPPYRDEAAATRVLPNCRR